MKSSPVAFQIPINIEQYQQVYLDQDGVLADFVQGIAGLVKQPISHKSVVCYDMWPSLGLSREEFWNMIHQAGVAFWEKLPLCEGAMALVGELRQRARRITILTQPSRSPDCRKGKALWLEKHGLADLELIFSDPRRGGKGKYAHSSALLIDDSSKNCSEFVQAGGQALLLRQPWSGIPCIKGIPEMSL